jgi:hypothetical protein
MVKYSFPYFTSEEMSMIAFFLDERINKEFNSEYLIFELPQINNKIVEITSYTGDLEKTYVKAYDKTMLHEYISAYNDNIPLLISIAEDIAGQWNYHWEKYKAEKLEELNKTFKEKIDIDNLAPEELYNIISTKFFNILQNYPKDKSLEDFLIIISPKIFNKLISYFKINHTLLSHLNNNFIPMLVDKLIKFNINQYIDDDGCYVIDSESFYNHK